MHGSVCVAVTMATSVPTHTGTDTSTEYGDLANSVV